MLHNPYEEDDIGDRLRQWGHWARDHVWAALGMPRATLLYQMFATGVIAKGYGYVPEPEHLEEEKTESAVRALMRVEKRLAEAIITQYVVRGTMRQKANDMRCCESTFKQLVRDGKVWIGRWLDAIDIAALKP